ncbi:MAG: hypothetical protein AVDCRST_MAG22-1957, partial [uncultured Rubrobacteraceae bacterium]
WRRRELSVGRRGARRWASTVGKSSRRARTRGAATRTSCPEARRATSPPACSPLKSPRKTGRSKRSWRSCASSKATAS